MIWVKFHQNQLVSSDCSSTLKLVFMHFLNTCVEKNIKISILFGTTCSFLVAEYEFELRSTHFKIADST